MWWCISIQQGSAPTSGGLDRAGMRQWSITALRLLTEDMMIDVSHRISKEGHCSVLPQLVL